ncbi:MAG: BCCT family transporter [Defluviitaleaceae bacterium]|nr:BCCT family transporter [Defluviitaleaceae bacterium]
MEKKKIYWGVLLVPSIIFITVIIIGIIDEETLVTRSTMLFESLMWNFGWLVSLTMLIFVAFVLVIIFHPIGKTRLGGNRAKPTLTYYQWFALTLISGIGTGIVFWGAVEPILFAMEPAPSLNLEPGSNEAVIWAMRTTFMHWTFIPYAIYVTFGIIMAYAIHNMKKPFNVSSGLVPLMGDNVNKYKIGSIVDILVVFALVGGVAASFGFGLLQLTQGASIIFGTPENSTAVMLVIAAVIVTTYLISSISGLRKGIMWLSRKNAGLFFIIMIFFIIFGPTAYIFNLFTQSFGSFLGNFVEGMTFTAPFPDSELWPQWWDMFWWVAWLAYGPLMGLFFAKLCYGRTLRGFVVVNWILPSAFGLVWFSAFGGTALYNQFFGGIDYYAIFLEHGAEAMTIATFEATPFTAITQPIMLGVVALSFVTLADSMVSTIASMTVKNAQESDEPPIPLKIFWGVLIAATALIFTLAAGLDGIRMVTTIAGFPVVFLGLAMVYGFVKHIIKQGI